MSASLDHLFMLVADMDRSIAFYERLGFNARRWGDYVRLVGEDGTYIGMEQRPSQVVVGQSGIELVIRVVDVDRMYADLLAAGVRFDGAPADQEWGARHVWLRDPDEHRMSLFSPIEGSG